LVYILALLLAGAVGAVPWAIAGALGLMRLRALPGPSLLLIATGVIGVVGNVAAPILGMATMLASPSAIRALGVPQNVPTDETSFVVGAGVIVLCWTTPWVAMTASWIAVLRSHPGPEDGPPGVARRSLAGGADRGEGGVEDRPAPIPMPR
jgi:hypothetical protein